MIVARKVFFYFWGYSLYIISVSLFNNINITLAHVIKICSFLILILCFLIDKYRKKELLVYSLLLGILLVISYQINDTRLLYTYLFIISFPSVEFKEVVKVDLAVRMTGFVITNALFFFGMGQDIILYRDGEIRHSFGYNHPNTCFAMLIMCGIDLLVLFFVNSKRLTKQKVLSIFLYVCLMLFYAENTGSRTGLFVFLLILALILLEYAFKIVSNNKYLAGIFQYTSLIACSISIIVAELYTKFPIFLRLNTIFTSRLSSMAYFWDNYKPSLFGQILTKVSTQEAEILNTRAYVLDNLYINLILQYGILFTIIFLLIYTITSKRLKTDNQYIYLIIMAGLAIYGFAEGLPLNIDFNVYLLLIEYVYKEITLGRVLEKGNQL